MNDSKDHKAAAEPPLDCRVGHDIVELLRDYVNNTDDIALRLAAANEIERLRDRDTCGRMCEATAYRHELRRLQRLIVAHVNASNNDDSAGDTFGALMEVAAAVPNAALRGGEAVPLESTVRGENPGKD